MNTKTTLNAVKGRLSSGKISVSYKEITMLLLVVLGSIYLAGCEPSKGQNNTAPSLLAVPVANPVHQKITEWEEYMGRFHAMERVEVRARVNGYIEEIKFKDGELVEKGDILFIIDQRPFQIDLKQAEAQLEQAKAEEKQAESAFDRVRSLRESKAISQEEYEQREQALFVAKARVEAARANVNQAQLNLEFTVVRAPISGKVSEDYVNVGNLISGGNAQATLLTTIVSIDPIYFYFEGSESDLLTISKNGNDGSGKYSNEVLAKLLDEEGYAHKGHIDFVDNEIDRGTGTFKGRAIFPNPDHVIESGMFANAKVENGGEHEAIMIPDASIATDQSRKIVFVLGDSNKVVAKPVELGPLHDKELRIVRSGISPNDRIIVGNIQKIRPGMKVEPEQKDLLTKK